MKQTKYSKAPYIQAFQVVNSQRCKCVFVSTDLTSSDIWCTLPCARSSMTGCDVVYFTVRIQCSLYLRPKRSKRHCSNILTAGIVIVYSNLCCAPQSLPSYQTLSVTYWTPPASRVPPVRILGKVQWVYSLPPGPSPPRDVLCLLQLCSHRQILPETTWEDLSFVVLINQNWTYEWALSEQNSFVWQKLL